MTATLPESGGHHPLTPAAPPRVVDDLYSGDEIAALFGAITETGPWPLVVAHHFSTTEEYLAVSGGRAAKPDATLSDFAAPVFRGYFAKEGVAFHEPLREIYQSRKLLEHAKSVHGAAYGMPHHMLFNLAVPSCSFDAGHFDSGNWRGMSSVDTPIWLLSVMAKSGLFEHWEVKTAQVITYFYDSDMDGGFTYWPDGPEGAPQTTFVAVLEHRGALGQFQDVSPPRSERPAREQGDAGAGDGVPAASRGGSVVGAQR